MARDSDILVGLDLGTTKITVVVAERITSRPDEAQIICVGEAPTRGGIRKGMIVNLEQAVNSISDAIADAESALRGLKISRVVVSFSGQKVDCGHVHGKISLGKKPRQIGLEDLDEVIENALSGLELSPETTCIHAIPVTYAVDGNKGIENPVEMTGKCLEVDVTTIAVPTSVVMNVVNCVEKAGVRVSGLVVKPLAEALGTLSKDDREIGASLVSIGGGTTSVSIFSDGHLIFVGEIAVGGDHITNDILQVMKIPLLKAEEIKKQIDLTPGADLSGTIPVENRGRKQELDKAEIADIVGSRLEELFTNAVLPFIRQLQNNGIPTEVIMTGGVSLSQGIDEFASQFLKVSVRDGLPVLKDQMQPGRNDCRYGAACGVIVYLIERLKNPYSYRESPMGEFKDVAHDKRHSTTTRKRAKRPSESFSTVIGRSVKELFRELF